MILSTPGDLCDVRISVCGVNDTVLQKYASFAVPLLAASLDWITPAEKLRLSLVQTNKPGRQTRTIVRCVRGMDAYPPKKVP